MGRPKCTAPNTFLKKTQNTFWNETQYVVLNKVYCSHFNAFFVSFQKVFWVISVSKYVVCVVSESFLSFFRKLCVSFLKVLFVISKSIFCPDAELSWVSKSFSWILLNSPEFSSYFQRFLICPGWHITLIILLLYKCIVHICRLKQGGK